MNFEPFGKKYVFPKDVLVRNFPEYMRSALASWLYSVMRNEVIDEEFYDRYIEIKVGFQHLLQIELREMFPKDWREFLSYTFDDPDRTCNIIAICLQNFATKNDAASLEYILSGGGSAYEVISTNPEAADYQKGNFNLAERVPPVVKQQADKLLSSNDIMQEAWNACYSHNPDYERVVSRSCDFLEGYLGKIYFPKDKKPQLTKFIHDFEAKPENLSYKGCSVVKPKSMLTSLLKEASDIRGQHTSGKGRKPTQDEAEFVLQTTIFIWNLHNVTT